MKAAKYIFGFAVVMFFIVFFMVFRADDFGDDNPG